MNEEQFFFRRFVINSNHRLVLNFFKLITTPIKI